jgi:membrane associated rhomboid family serine protease
MRSNSKIQRPFRYSFSNVTLWLVGINIVVFLAGLLFARPPYYDPVKGLLALTPEAVLSGWVWQLFTYMFVHENTSHILVNMLGLFIFGIQVERRLGSKEFLLFYLVTGTLAGVFSFIVYLFTGSATVMLLGASGAVFAVMLAFAVLDPESVIYIYGIIPVRAPVMVLGYTAIEIGSQLFSFRSGVAHFTHLAGFGFAWLYCLIRLGLNPWYRLFRR